MAIRYSEPVKPIIQQAKEIRRQAEALEAEAQKLIDAKRGPGRRHSGNETVTLRVDKRVVEFFKTYGDDWKKAMADVLATEAGL